MSTKTQQAGDYQAFCTEVLAGTQLPTAWRQHERVMRAAPELLAICQEIANDSHVDLVDSERRIRLYAAISNAEGR